MTGDAARDTVPSWAQVQWQYREGESSMGWAALGSWAHAVRENPEQEECLYAVGPTGVYILEKTPSPQGGGISADIIWGEKYEKAKRKRQKM
jgi:hypothetical protein